MEISYIVSKYSDFIKQQIAHNENRAVRYKKNDPARSKSYADRAVTFQHLLADLGSLCVDSKTESSSVPLRLSNNIHLMPQDIRDLPEELLKELGISSSDRFDFTILDIIDDMGGTASLDKILVEVYRRTGTIEKRTKMVARLYRMIGKGKLFSAEGKGVYTTIPPEGSRKNAHE